MRRGIITLLLVGLAGLTLSAGPFAGHWETLFSVDPDGGTFVDGFQSMLTIDYTMSTFITTSYSEFQEFGFLWQEFSAAGSAGAIDLQGNILFGPLTAEFLYAQFIAEISLGGAELGYYYAMLGEAVLGGPADGFAFRLAGSIGSMDFVSITELGARIADDDFDGITIVHTRSGFSRSYITDPVVPGQGFTGQKVTIGGLSLGCVEGIEATFYITCGGFDYVLFELDGIVTGLNWLSFDMDLRFEVQTKTITMTPALIVGEVLCLKPYFALVPGLPSISIDGIVLGGVELIYRSNGVTLRDVTVLDAGRYVITTPEFGSQLVSIEDAIASGYAYYVDYWELLSLEVDGEACCGGRYSLLINSYFEEGSTEIFGWSMTSFEGWFGIGTNTALTLALTVDGDGLEGMSIGFAFDW